MDFAQLKEHKNLYTSMGLQGNPFSIAPLFRDFRNIKECEEDEKLFFISEEIFKEFEILLETKEQRVLLYGLYGVGKTTLVDFFLYLAHNYHHRFCTRVVLTEDNLERAINELLHSLCMDILSEISQKHWTHPVTAIRKWIVENRHGDTLMESLACLMGRYSEVKETAHARKSQKQLKLSPGSLGAELGQENEIQIRKVIQSYVDVLPVRKVMEYLRDFREIVRQCGFEDIVLFIDEADHLPHIDQFLRMLTRSRELFFTSGYTYFIAGSVEVARYTETMGAIFDHLIYVKPLNEEAFHAVIEKRIDAKNSTQKVYAGQVFLPEALQIIFKQSRGILKEALRLAENSVKNAAKERATRVNVTHCMDVIKTGEEEITLELQEKHIQILKFLAQTDYASSSDENFQQSVSLSRSHLRLLMEYLLKKGYVRKEKRGKKSFYIISSQYRPYFAKGQSL